MHVISKMAQWERAGPITQRTVDQNYLLLSWLFPINEPAKDICYTIDSNN